MFLIIANSKMKLHHNLKIDRIIRKHSFSYDVAYILIYPDNSNFDIIIIP